MRSSVRYRTFPYQAQSDIADHGCRTECPPMSVSLQSEKSFASVSLSFTLNQKQTAHPTQKYILKKYFFMRNNGQSYYYFNCAKSNFARFRDILATFQEYRILNFANILMPTQHDLIKNELLLPTCMPRFTFKQCFGSEFV